jgi:hypothetical protein
VFSKSRADHIKGYTMCILLEEFEVYTVLAMGR